MTSATLEVDENNMTNQDEGFVTLVSQFLKQYRVSFILTGVATVLMIVVGLTMSKKDGAAGFAQASAALLRDRLPVEEHMSSLADLFWLPEKTTLIANIHDGTFGKTQKLTIDDDTAIRLASLIADGDRAGAEHIDLNPIIIDLLFSLAEDGRLRKEPDGRLVIPLQFALTTVTQYAGMRIYSDEGLKSFERNLSIKANLVSFEHPLYDDTCRVASITKIEHQYNQ